MSEEIDEDDEGYFEPHACPFQCRVNENYDDQFCTCSFEKTEECRIMAVKH